MSDKESKKPSPESNSDLVRSSYISDVASIEPFDDLEAKDIQETLEWLKSSPTLHKPANMDKHLGVLFLMTSPSRDQTFLLNHRKAQKWLPPGGHVDEGLTFQQAIRLEMQEELDTEPNFLTIKPFFLTQTLTGGLNAGHFDITAWFQIEGDPTKEITVQKKEAPEGRWFSFDDILEDPEMEHLKRPSLKLRTGRNQL